MFTIAKTQNTQFTLYTGSDAVMGVWWWDGGRVTPDGKN